MSNVHKEAGMNASSPLGSSLFTHLLLHALLEVTTYATHEVVHTSLFGAYVNGYEDMALSSVPALTTLTAVTAVTAVASSASSASSASLASSTKASSSAVPKPKRELKVLLPTSKSPDCVSACEGDSPITYTIQFTATSSSSSSVSRSSLKLARPFKFPRQVLPSSILSLESSHECVTKVLMIHK